MLFISSLVCTYLLFVFISVFSIGHSVQMLLHTVVSYLQFTIERNMFTVACPYCSQTALGLCHLSTIVLEAD